jgi:hypothetical protein
MSTSQFDKALQLINELNESSGKSDRRESYKMQILSQGKYQNAEISNLIDQIKSIPKRSELHFADLSVQKIMKPIKYWKRHENWKQIPNGRR